MFTQGNIALTMERRALGQDLRASGLIFRMPGAVSPKLSPELPGSALTDQDLEKLASCWIGPDLAACALLRRVRSIDGATLIRREGRSGDYAGIAISNIFPDWRLVA